MNQRPPIVQFVRRWSEPMADLTRGPDRMAYARKVLPELLARKDLIGDFLERLASGAAHRDFKQSSLFENEHLIYMDPGRRFSVRLYFHPPNAYTPIHDHNAWGVNGSPAGTLGIIKYRIRESSETGGPASILETDRRLLSPGETDTSLPLDQGIHRTGAPDDRINVMISIYGSPARRLYINEYEPDSGRVIRRYPPKIARRNLARQALQSL